MRGQGWDNNGRGSYRGGSSRRYENGPRGTDHYAGGRFNSAGGNRNNNNHPGQWNQNRESNQRGSSNWNDRPNEYGNQSAYPNQYNTNRPDQWRETSNRNEQSAATYPPRKTIKTNDNTNNYSSSFTGYRRNDPTPFSAVIANEKALQEPIPRRSRVNTEDNKMEVEEGTTVKDTSRDNNININMVPMVLTKDWLEYTVQEQYELLFPTERPYQFPLLDIPKDYDKRKARGVEEAMKYLREECFQIKKRKEVEEYTDSESDQKESDDDDEDQYIIIPQVPCRDKIIEKYASFVKALPFCTPLDVGYIALNTFLDADKFCWCPCQRNKFWRWRDYFKVDQNLDYTCSNTQKFTPHALRKHLESKIMAPPDNDDDKSNILHALVLKYLTGCYQNYTWVRRKDIWLDHKSHYDLGTEKFKEAEAAQNDHIHQQIRCLTTKLEETHMLHQSQKRTIEKLQTIHPLKAKIASTEIEINGRIYRRLNIDESTITRKLGVIPAKIFEYDSKRKDFFDLYELRFTEQWRRQKKANASLKKTVLQIDVSQQFLLPDMLNEWIESQSALGVNLDETNRYQWLNFWSVNYNACIEAQMHKDDEVIAVDEGGPTRAFLFEVWRQLRGLTISLNGRRVQLFNDDGVPLDNEFISYQVGTKEAEPEVENLIRLQCRILGRFMFYVIAMSCRKPINTEKELYSKMVLASHVLPEFYRYYYLKDIDPLNELYPIEKLARDVLAAKHESGFKVKNYEKSIQLYINEIVSDDDCSSDDPRIRFREAAKQDLIDSRSWVVEGIKEGLTLEGAVSMSTLFAGIPMEYIDSMLFADEIVLAEDIIAVLAVKYDEGNPEEQESYELLRGSLQNQKAILRVEGGIRSGYLPELLRRENPTFLAKFVEFITGSSFIPKYKDGFEIKIEFNFGESRDARSLTVAHTCENTLKLPALAYDGNEEMFAQKLKQSIELCAVKGFDMS